MWTRFIKKISPKTKRKNKKSKIDDDTNVYFIKMYHPDLIHRRNAILELEKILGRQEIILDEVDRFYDKYLERNIVKISDYELTYANQLKYSPRKSEVVNILIRINNALIRMKLKDDEQVEIYKDPSLHDVNKRSKSRKEITSHETNILNKKKNNCYIFPLEDNKNIYDKDPAISYLEANISLSDSTINSSIFDVSIHDISATLDSKDITVC